jgi:pimeloyl-ACP methyl ester carboxylesterase
MKANGVLFLHGYGVRGGIWMPLRKELEGRSGPVAAPDLDASDIEQLQTLAVTRASEFSREVGGPILLVGHSLGAVIAALTANRLGRSAIAGAVLIAPPYGTREKGVSPVLRFLLRHRLLPPALIRPRFFSPHTPLETQKRVFREAVPEAPDLQKITFEQTWFHTALLAKPLPVPTLVIASEGDRIVSSDQSVRFARAIQAELELIPAERNVGHDDFFASPRIASETAGQISRFVEEQE